MAVLDRDFPRLTDLVGVRWAKGHEVGDSPQCSQMLDGLMCRAVFAHADAVMGEDPDGTQVRDGGHTQCRPQIVRENEEGCAKRDHPTVVGHAVDDRAHPVLAHAKVEVASFVRIAPFLGGAGKRGATGQPRDRRRRQVSRSTSKLRQPIRNGIEHLS